MGRLRCDIGPHISNQDHSALESVLAQKLTPAVPELANVRRTAHRTSLAVRPIQAPLTRLRVVQAESQPFDVAAGTVNLELFDLRAPVPNLSSDGCAVKFHPCFGSVSYTHL